MIKICFLSGANIFFSMTQYLLFINCYFALCVFYFTSVTITNYDYILSNIMEINIKELDFQISINSCYDEIIQKMEQLTNMEIQLLRKFEHQVGNSQNRFKMVHDVRAVMCNLQEMFKDVKDYFTEMNAAFIFDFFRKMHVLMICGYNFLSQALLVNYDQIQNKQAQAKNSQLLSCKNCKCLCGSAGKSDKRKQNRQIQQFDYKINVLQNQQTKLKDQIQSMYDKMMLQKDMIERTKPSLAVRQLQDMKQHIQNVMESTNTIFQQTYMLKYVQFKNYMTQIKKPEDLISHFISNMNFTMKHKFMSSMTKALFKMQNNQKHLQMIPGTDMWTQTEDIAPSEMKQTINRPFLLKPDKNQNLLTRQRKNNQKMVVELQFNKKQINQITKETQKLKQTLKKLIAQSQSQKQNYQTLLTLYTSKNEQLQTFKQQNSWMKSERENQYKKFRNQISSLKKNSIVSKSEQEVQVAMQGRCQSVSTQTQGAYFQNSVDNQVIKLLKRNNQKMIVKLNQKQKKISEQKKQLKQNQEFKKVKLKFCDAVKTLAKLYSLSHLITPEITDKNSPSYVDQQDYVISKMTKFLHCLKQKVKTSSISNNKKSGSLNSKKQFQSQQGTPIRTRTNKRRSSIQISKQKISNNSFCLGQDKEQRQINSQQPLNSQQSNNQICSNTQKKETTDHNSLHIPKRNNTRKKSIFGKDRLSIINRLDNKKQIGSPYNNLLTQKYCSNDSIKKSEQNLQSQMGIGSSNVNLQIYMKMDSALSSHNKGKQEQNRKQKNSKIQHQSIQVQTQQSCFNQPQFQQIYSINKAQEGNYLLNKAKSNRQLTKKPFLGKLLTQSNYKYSQDKNYRSVNNTLALSEDQISQMLKQGQNQLNYSNSTNANVPRNSTQSRLSYVANNQMTSRLSRFTKPILFNSKEGINTKRQSQIHFDQLKLAGTEQSKQKDVKYTTRQYKNYYKVKQSKFKHQQRNSYQNSISMTKNIETIDQMNQSMKQETLIQVKRKNPVERPSRQSPNKQFLKLAKLLLISQSKQNLISLIQEISKNAYCKQDQRSKIIIKVNKKGYSPRGSTVQKVNIHKNDRNMKAWALF